MRATAVLMTLAAVFGVSYGYSQGVYMKNPMDGMKSFCTTGNMRPNHGTMPKNTPPPFDLIVPSSYRTGQPVEVILRAKPGNKFKGFFITADAEIAAGAISGDFAAVNPANAKATTFCGVKGLTHTNPLEKTEVKVKWTPPREYHHGKVQFKATVVQNKLVFWTGVLSATLSPVPQAGVEDQEQYAQKRAQEMMQNFNTNGGGMDFSKLLQGMQGMQGAMPPMPPMMPMGGPPPTGQRSPQTSGGMPDFGAMFRRMGQQG